MQFAINDNGLKIASPAAVQAFLKRSTGRDHPPSAFRRWTDAELAARSVYRLEDRREAGNVLQHKAPGVLQLEGDIAVLAGAAVDDSLERAQDTAFGLLDSRYQMVRDGGTTVLTKPVFTDTEHLAEYNIIQNALDAGEPFPAGGIPILLMNHEKVNVNAAQFATLLRTAALHRIQCMQRYEALYDEIANAANVAALLTVLDSLSAGWPANPEF